MCLLFMNTGDRSQLGEKGSWLQSTTLIKFESGKTHAHSTMAKTDKKWAKQKTVTVDLPGFDITSQTMPGLNGYKGFT